MLANINHHEQAVHHHIPDIDATTRSSISPPPVQNSHMSPMLLNNTRDTLNPVATKGEEPKSPQPSSFVPENNSNSATENEEMVDANDTTAILLSPGEDNMDEDEDVDEMEDD